MKKLNKLVAILVAMAMVLSLSIIAAFADPATTYAPADAKLAKYLQKGTGVDNPGATYNFTFTPVTTGAPSATNTSIVLDTTEDANGDLHGFLTVAQIFEGVSWPSTGEYTYTVTEAAATNYNEAAAPNDTLTIDSSTTYTLRVYVQSVNGVNTPTGVTVQKGEDKVDPTNPPTVADDGQGNGFSFTNVYAKNLVDDDQEDPSQDKTGVLDVTKNVTGDYGDKVNEFPFVLTYTKPDNNSGAIKYKVIPAEVTDGAAIAAIEEQEASGGTIPFDLAHGDKLIITQAPQGTKWYVTENLGDADVQNVNSYVASSNKYMPATAPTGGQALTTTEQVLSAADAITVTNALDSNAVTPTGILLNNLPYIVLALVAIGGLCAYVIVRRKNADEA